jgi:hypothetical protein
MFNIAELSLLRKKSVSSVVVQFEIHRASNRFGPVGNLIHAKS